MKGYQMLHAGAGLAVTALLAAMIGCGANIEDEGDGQDDEAVGEVEQAISGGGSCCSAGYFTCPATGDTYDYGVPGCGWGGTKINMGNYCRNNCSVACIDSGWHNIC